jgi:hypothetical protein
VWGAARAASSRHQMRAESGQIVENIFLQMGHLREADTKIIAMMAEERIIYSSAYNFCNRVSLLFEECTH